MSSLLWQCAPLAELSTIQLYQALALRARVFVLEQQCLYLDPDGVDLRCWHLLGSDSGGGLLAYARLLPPLAKGPAHRLPEIGRVVTAPEARGAGQGRQLMQQALRECARLWPGQDLALSAQAHLQGFYTSLGFEPVSAVYDEDGIAHIDMQCKVR
ncbi:ElaA protein [Paucibacter oligotrophus]|uniref:ElaA protein n=1 Tax=Roseateles oligotrophus TaxID=1769250 RepID=A0A840LCI4_9BURK|nr:GNAT family N-acetyltransferase [Roseateles oligotrophus]MBB4845441.1 ElaA protein [Roseateles oligotrophus]